MISILIDPTELLCQLGNNPFLLLALALAVLLEHLGAFLDYFLFMGFHKIIISFLFGIIKGFPSTTPLPPKKGYEIYFYFLSGYDS